MTGRLLVAVCALASVALSQQLPSYQWVKEVDGSGADTFAGLGTDAQGNIYIAGSTLSSQFPVKSAVQAQIASAGLYLINGTSSTALGLSSASAIAVDPQSPSTLYAVSHAALVKSVDGGVTFAPATLPSSSVSSIAIEPGNDQILFAGTGDRGLLKSVDGGATWTASSNGLPVQSGGPVVQNLWIDPTNLDVMLAETPSGLARTSDGAANWQLTTISGAVANLAFDPLTPGVVYVATRGRALMKSVDFGKTFAAFSAPAGVAQVVPDPIQPGRLIGGGLSGLYQSTDGGSTWTQESATSVFDLVADPINRVYYAPAATDSSVVRISESLQTITPVGPKATGEVLALAVANGKLYAANLGSADVFVTKLDPAGNIVYSTYFGGSGDDGAVAMAVDAAGDVYVAGATGSLDFPISNGAYASSGTMFIFKLNPDGSLGYSTYFSGTNPEALAVDAGGSAWLLGSTEGGLPVTPGALATTFCCTQPISSFGPPIMTNEASLTRFDASGSSLIFSTYVPGSNETSGFGSENAGSALAVAGDDTAYVGGPAGIFHIDSTGSTLISALPAAGSRVQITTLQVDPLAIAIGPDGSLYVAGTPGAGFQPTPGAFQTTVEGPPALPGQGGTNSPVAIERIDAGLQNVLAATWFGSIDSSRAKVITVDPAGNVYVGGSTAPVGLPTRTPLNGGFTSPTGFLSELSGDLSTLIFSSYFGDTERFAVSGAGIGANGSVVIGGITNSAGFTGIPANVWLNSLALTPLPSLRIDAVDNAASLLDYPISAGETIVVRGAGFGSDAQLTIGDEVVAPIAITSTTITATVPADVPAAAAAVVVKSGGASSNQVLMPVSVTAPGLFSANGTGYGQGYILNKDGTLNAPENPAAPGDRITIYATGVGPVSFTQCCAVTQYPVSVYIDSVYCAGISAIMGPVNGLPGSVFQITVYVPEPGIVLPPLSGVVMQINGVSSQPGIAISIAQ